MLEKENCWQNLGIFKAWFVGSQDGQSQNPTMTCGLCSKHFQDVTLNFSQNEKKGRFFNFLVIGWSKSLKTLKNAKLREDSKNLIKN